MTEAQKYFYDGQDRRVNRDSDSYFNAQFEANPLYIGPGEHKTSQDPGHMIIANIGHGMAVTAYETNLKIGGMAYILLPEQALQTFPYFDQLDQSILDSMIAPMENCIKDLENLGAEEDKLRIRLIGASSLPTDKQDQGTKTYVFIKEHFTRKGLNIASEYIAGPYIRRVHYFPATGRAVRRILRRQEDMKTVQSDEEKFQDKFKNI